MRVSSKSLTISNASAVKREGFEALEKSDGEIDFSDVENVDSSAIAVLMAWIRRAEEKKLKIRVTNVPQALHSLILLYGLESMLEAYLPSKSR